MSIPTNFYTQQPSLLPQGLQSLIQGGQLNPMPMAQAMQQQQPAIQQFQAQQQQGMPMGNPMQQAPNYNQMAQMAAPIYQPPPPAPAQPPVSVPVSPQPVQRQPLVRPWSGGNSINHLEIQ